MHAWHNEFGLHSHSSDHYPESEFGIIYHLDTLGYSSTDSLPIFAVKLSANGDIDEDEYSHNNDEEPNNEDTNNEDTNNEDTNNEDTNNEDINNEDTNNEDTNNEDTNNEDQGSVSSRVSVV